MMKVFNAVAQRLGVEPESLSFFYDGARIKKGMHRLQYIQSYNVNLTTHEKKVCF
jgi:hypothetical protein